jgi:phospholipid/cholesterol/gamma-HCH transport system substrate-binding protein
MLGRRIRIQVTLFIIMALLGVSYVGVHYVGLQRLFSKYGYTVRLDLADSGGIFTNAEVTYRGVTVGRVGGMRLTADGIQVDLHLTRKGIPADLTAAVADRSAIGEQYVDLRPKTDTAPYLADGSEIHQNATILPPPVEQLLFSTDALARSVPIKSLQTVVDELDQAFRDSGQKLQLLLDSSSDFFKSADVNYPQTAELLDNSTTVLATQQESSSSIIAFSRSLAQIGDQLKKSNGDLNTVIGAAPPAAREFTGLFTDVGTNLSVLLTNLLTTSQVFLGNADGVRELFVKLPEVISVGSSVLTPKGANVALIPTFFNPLPCTAGYQGTTLRRGTDVSAGPPLNTAAHCAAPPVTGVDVRGSQNAPGGTYLPGPSVLKLFTSAEGPMIHTLPGLMGLTR